MKCSYCAFAKLTYGLCFLLPWQNGIDLLVNACKSHIRIHECMYLHIALDSNVIWIFDITKTFLIKVLFGLIKFYSVLLRFYILGNNCYLGNLCRCFMLQQQFLFYILFFYLNIIIIKCHLKYSTVYKLILVVKIKNIKFWYFREYVPCLFDLWCEVSPGHLEMEPHIIRKYPEDYNKEDELKNIPNFTFPCNLDK